MNPARTHLNILISGVLALLPLVVTVALLAWAGAILHSYIGPQSRVGRILSSVGLAFVTNELVAYLVGILLFLTLAYVLGTIVQSRFRQTLTKLKDRTLSRVPLIGPIYDLTSRFVGLLDRKEQTDLQAMSPVWCYFGGEGAVAVLALMPNPEPIELGGQRYLAVLVPTAPVPFGGGLIYVPEQWVKPAGFGMDRLTSVYVSMGVTAPTPTAAAPTSEPRAPSTGSASEPRAPSAGS